MRSMQEIIDGQATPEANAKSIKKSLVKELCHYADIPYVEFLKKKVSERHCVKRFVIWTQLKNAGYSLQNIGDASNKSHCAIFHGINRLTERVALKDAMATTELGSFYHRKSGGKTLDVSDIFGINDMF